LQSQVVGASGAAQQASIRKQQQAGRSSRTCVHCNVHAGDVRGFGFPMCRFFAGKWGMHAAPAARRPNV